jgi:sugar phosphate permease
LTVHSQSSQRWVIVGLLFAAGFINYLDRAILSVALPLVSRDLHLDPTAKGVLLSAFFRSYALMQLPVGFFADRISLRWFYAGMFTLWCLACGFTGLATTLGALMVLRVVLGIGESVYLPGGIKVVSLLFESGERGSPNGCGRLTRRHDPALARFFRIESPRISKFAKTNEPRRAANEFSLYKAGRVQVRRLSQYVEVSLHWWSAQVAI